MKVLFHKQFSKNYRCLSPKTKKQFEQRLKLFLEYPFHPTLNNHALHGVWQDYRSINISGNFRALYRVVEDDVIEFVIIDTHSNLYS